MASAADRYHTPVPTDDAYDDEQDEHAPLASRYFGARSALQAWVKKDIDWAAVYPDEFGETPASDLEDEDDTPPPPPPRFEPGLVRDLVPLDIGKLYKSGKLADKRLGLIPHMASCSKGELGVLNAESFCERVLSQSNCVMTEGNTLLSDEELEMLVILRMNRDFMDFMREHYKHLNYQQFSQTTIDMADNTPDGSDNA